MFCYSIYCYQFLVCAASRRLNIAVVGASATTVFPAAPRDASHVPQLTLPRRPRFIAHQTSPDALIITVTARSPQLDGTKQGRLSTVCTEPVSSSAVSDADSATATCRTSARWWWNYGVSVRSGGSIKQNACLP